MNPAPLAATPTGKQAQILQAAAKIFALKGFGAATIEEIASLARVGKGTIYLYFPSKEKLFLAVIAYSMQTYLEKVQILLQEKEEPLVTLKLLMQFHSEFIENHLDLARIAFRELHRVPEAKAFQGESFKFHERMQALLLEFVQQGQSQGVFRGDIDPKAAVLGIQGMLNSLAAEQFMAKNKQIVLADVLKILLTGLQNPNNTCTRKRD